MAKPRLLITGGSGLLALNWACAMRATWQVVLGTHRYPVRLDGIESRPLDLEDAARLEGRLAELAPDVVVHAAALTSVEQCEDDPALARHVNAELARNVASVTAARGMYLVHISTDHLFAGDRSHYCEDDAPAPLNEYARSKLLGEEWVRQFHPQALVLRTNFYGWGHARRQSFSDWVLQSLRGGREVTMFDDVHFTPLLADALAVATHRLLDLSAVGLYHLAGDERISKYDFGIRLARAFGLPETLIRRGSVAEAGLQANRPRDMSLDSGRARALLGAGTDGLDEHFQVLRRQEEAGRREELFQAVTE
ncbi:MAG: NAD(P)-dependent oxidoreductase [Rhodocyclaceae bacterium]|nr:MAG: NAD(P)-dependent oxidoreductase [Rhodocyclaceae bacterium]